MTHLIEDFCSYEQSRIWEIQHAYYAGRGSKAWLSGEIPSASTNCLPMAKQHAQVLIALVDDAIKNGRRSAEDDVRVLEVGGGSGLFVRHLFDALAFDCGERGRDLLGRLTYVFSDFSALALEEALAEEPLAMLRRGGYIVPALYDVTRPSRLLTVQGEPIEGNFSAVFASYLCCVLPVTLLRKTSAGLEEKTLRLTVRAPQQQAAPTGDDVWTALLRDPTRPNHLTDAVQMDTAWRPIASNDALPDPLHRAAFDETVAALPTATVRYPRMFLDFIERLKSSMVPGGVLFVTDFGKANFDELEGLEDTPPTIYGNTLNHGVDFPVLDGFCKAAGLGLLRTKDPLVSLQRAAIVYGSAPTPALTRAFRHHHIRNNLCQDFIDLRLVAQQLLAAKNYSRMARVLRKLVAFEPRSARAHHLLGVGCLRAGRNQLAIRYLRRGRRLDKKGRHDFDFYLGCAYVALNRDEQARRALKRSLRREPRATAFAILGSVYTRLGKFRCARTSFTNALALDPNGNAAEEVRRNLIALPKRRIEPPEQHAIS